MPGGDRTGPMGEGPATGRRLGDCVPGTPGQQNAAESADQQGVPRFGFGRSLVRGLGRIGVGLGRGRFFRRGCGRGFGGGR